VKVKLVPEDEARLDKIISIGEQILAALGKPAPVDFTPVLNVLGEIEGTLQEIANNTQPEPKVVGIEIIPCSPATKP
jgi:hypothetical protein